MRNDSGTSNTSATSNASGANSKSGCTSETTGVMAKPVAVKYWGMLPSTSTCCTGRPVSSWASRNAAATGVASLTSIRPPGS